MTNRAALLSYPGRHAPHAVLEVNQRCNIACRACYKRKSGTTKPYRRVTEEVDGLLERRRLSTVTIAGGEPTLHPQLPEIVGYCSAKGLAVQLITNGVELPDGLLERCRREGLSHVILHVDSLQSRPDAPPGSTEAGLSPLREAIIARIAGHGIDCSLGLTVYRSTLGDLPAVIDWVIAHPRLRRLVVFCCVDIAGNLRRHAGGAVLGTDYPAAGTTAADDDSGGGGSLTAEQVGVADLEALLSPRGMHPVFYVASSRSTQEKRWLVYHALALRGRRGVEQVLHLGQPFPRAAGMLQRLAQLTGRPPIFGRQLGEAQCFGLAVAHALTCGRLSEARRALAFCARRLRGGATISSRPITVQQPPEVTGEGRLVYCRECPDATIRNGTLVPVCLADYLVGPDRDSAPRT